MFYVKNNKDYNLDMLLYLLFIGKVEKCKSKEKKGKYITVRNKKQSNSIGYEFRQVRSGFMSYDTLLKEEKTRKVKREGY